MNRETLAIVAAGLLSMGLWALWPNETPRVDDDQTSGRPFTAGSPTRPAPSTQDLAATEASLGEPEATAMERSRTLPLNAAAVGPTNPEFPTGSDITADQETVTGPNGPQDTVETSDSAETSLREEHGGQEHGDHDHAVQRAQQLSVVNVALGRARQALADAETDGDQERVAEMQEVVRRLRVRQDALDRAATAGR